LINIDLGQCLLRKTPYEYLEDDCKNINAFCCQTQAKIMEIERSIAIIYADWPKIFNNRAYLRTI